MAQSDWSSSNIKNSISAFIATKLITQGYVLYWSEQDGFETADGYYGEWSTNYATLLLDVDVASRVAAAKGMVTIRGPLTANPRFLVRPTLSGSVLTQDEVPIPAIAIDVGLAAALTNYEMGTRLMWRSRHLVIHALARTEPEQTLLGDLIAEWFDQDVEIDVMAHDSGTPTVVGSVRIVSPTSEGNIEVSGPDVTTYATELNAALEYVC